MPLATRFADFLHDLQQLERAAVHSHGPLILEAFTRHSPYDEGAVWLRDARGSGLRLAAKSQSCLAPEILDNDAALDAFLLVPIRTSKDDFGVVALSGDEASDDDLQMLRAAGAYAATLLNSQRLAQEMREGDFQLKNRLWERQPLYDIGRSIAGTLDLDELADEVLFRMISLINARRAALLLRDGDSFKKYREFGEIEIGEELLREIAARGEAVSLEEGTVVAVPIKGNNEIIGVLSAAECESRDGGVAAFEANELRLLSLFANQVAIALENARLHKEALAKQAMEREMELAATIQRDILPKALPQAENIEVAVLARPARQVGGDYHAFFEREGTLTTIVADVAGKSMPAALLVSAVHAALHLLFAEGRELGEIATELNRHLHRWSAENKFVTMILISIDPEAETLEFINAGHNPCYVLTGGRIEKLHSHGLPIGILATSRYMTQTRPFATGSTVVLYSDGITEAENLDGDEFGNERLEALLAEHAGDSAAALRDAIAAAVDAFVGDAPQKDDETLVVART